MTARSKILVIDDREENLSALSRALSTAVTGDSMLVEAWRPAAGDDETPLEVLSKRVTDDTVLVATDYDLTQSVKGLFGSAVSNWCQARGIPVCNFSRGTHVEALRDPGLFDILIPPTPAEGAREIRRVALGFREIEEGVQKVGADRLRSPAEALALLLGNDGRQSDFAPYLTRVGAANGALVHRLRESNSDVGLDDTPTADYKSQILIYVIGHVLLNNVLQFPGPILDERMLAAYCAMGADPDSRLAVLFQDARYVGPFSSDKLYFWRRGVDRILGEVDLPGEVVGDREGDDLDFDVLNRWKLEALLEGPASTHECDRCGGVRGGFWCPFSLRPTCLRSDCSVASSGWIPEGADLSRIEREFYEEWAPLLGY